MGYLVEQSIPPVLHPVRDASPAGCKTGRYGFSTKRCIPNGMLFVLTALPALPAGRPSGRPLMRCRKINQ
ncbi:MAG: hypothetical protein LBQ01_01160 [Prevotellaceae bacterium]|nr:hypothetical protein [Prevotellaceae bacterium]